MAKTLPYFRWYPADAQSDLKYRGLSRAERGLFHDALDFAWMNDGLPDDELAIGRALNMTVRELKTLWPAVRECFFLKDGSFRNKRQELERSSALEKGTKASASANQRWGKTPQPAQSERTPFVMRTHSEGNARAYGSVSDSDSEEKKKVEIFERCWSRHKKHRGGFAQSKDAVVQHLISLDGLDWAAMDSVHERYANYWDEEGWTQSTLSFLEWITAGEPEPPRARDPTARKRKRDVLLDAIEGTGDYAEETRL